MRKKLVVGFAALALLLLATPVIAEDVSTPEPTSSPEATESPRPKGLFQDLRQLRQENRQENREEIKNRLTDTKLRSCQARQNAIKNRMDSLTKLASNIEDKFSSIAKRVEDFYASSGKTVSNYQDLANAIGTAKDKVDTDLAKAKTDSSGFDCTQNDPKGLMQTFREDMQLVKSDLKAYRTSIKNLIVAVRPLAPEGTEKPEFSGSPEATVTPVATPTATPTESPTPSPTP